MYYFKNLVKNNGMTALESLYFLIPAVFILILVSPLFLKLNVAFNVLNQTGSLSIMINKFRVLYYKIIIKDKKIILENDKGVEVQEFGEDDPELLFVEELIKQLKDKIKLKDLLVFYNIGLLDAFTSAMVAGYINLILTIIFCGIKSEKPTANLNIYDTVSYNREIAEVMVLLKISISIFDILYSMLLALILSKKRAKSLVKNTANGTT